MRRVFARSKIYDEHAQASAIDFIDHIVGNSRFERFAPTMGTNSRPNFIGMSRTKVSVTPASKRGTPQLNGKVERSHRLDQEEFYQLLSYKDDGDLEARLDEWETFYNFHRPHGAFNGKTP